MRKVLLLIPVVLILTSCQEKGQIDLSSLSAKERAAVSSLRWLEKADAERDVLEAIKRGDRRLLAMATRGANIPGVPVEMASRAESLCGIRYVAGSTDAVMGDTHLKLLQAAQRYASEYNRIMLDACLAASP